jgi:hypothetical protein
VPLSSEPIPRVERLAEAVPMLRRGALGMAALAFAAAAGEVALFGLDAEDLLSGGLIAAVVFALLHYLTDAGRHVPHGFLQPAPGGVEIEPGGVDRSTWLGIGAIVIVVVALASVFDWEDDGLLPGILLGYAAANTVALVRIRTWERANGRRVLYDPDSKRRRPLAGPPL